MSTVLHVHAEGPALRDAADALELIFAEAAEGAEWIAVPATRLDPVFFDLSSGVAGDFVQKFVNYKQRMAVVGDIADHLARSAALRDFVRESNRGQHVWFVADEDELARRLSSRQAA